MITVIESPIFTKYWPDYWSEGERGEFSAWIAENPDAGDVVPGSGGIRKIRWAAKGQGKRGGVRVIYFATPSRGLLWLLTIYAKSNKENIPAHILRALKKELVDGYE
ncbi:MAG: type II toxin-antitoxin system RelE/ParE family toxin [Pseudomonadales bacterium]|nr:type II toxin-antitoxin system RelE/ParE family toxin [Pseudomonadales bacterium]